MSCRCTCICGWLAGEASELRKPNKVQCRAGGTSKKRLPGAEMGPACELVQPMIFDEGV